MLKSQIKVHVPGNNYWYSRAASDGLNLCVPTVPCVPAFPLFPLLPQRNRGNSGKTGTQGTVGTLEVLCDSYILLT